MPDITRSILLKGQYHVKDGLVTTTCGKATKTTQVGGEARQKRARPRIIRYMRAPC
jgi:hypothetical protein